jgi:hypothetical protein
MGQDVADFMLSHSEKLGETDADGFVNRLLPFGVFYTGICDVARVRRSWRQFIASIMHRVSPLARV